ncbi:CHASE3 domain-containing protein [Dyella silvatica]|uniref:CHASE3 domain-containing protein n=1 Tax=Dyella silvatica TaxID=2992128 RepID=UPI002B1CB07E|nr:CHASE3 domain-containing protein [Dyella silvatica]
MPTSNVTSTREKRYSWLANLPIRHKIILAIGLMLSLLMINSLINVGSHNKQTEARHWADHTYQVLLEIEGLQRTAVTGQLGLRGFLLTHSASELARLDASVKAFQEQLLQLRELTSDNPLQQLRIDHINALVAQWTRELQTMLTATKTALQSADAQAGAQEVARIQADYIAHRSVRVEDYAAALDEMKDTERQLLALRTRGVEHLVSQTFYVNIFSAVIGLLFGLLVIWLTSRMVTA